MKALRIIWAFAAVVAVAGCSVGTSSETSSSSEAKETTEPTFSNIILTDDESARPPKTEFPASTQKFTAFFEMKNMAAGSTIRGVWYAVSAKGVEPNFKIDEATLELKEGVNEGNFNLSRSSNSWPEGEYRLDFVYNEKVLDSIKFKVTN